MQQPKEPPRLKKAKFPQGKSVRVNLKLSEASLKSFDDIKNRKACKVSAEVFDYICDFADSMSNITVDDNEPLNLIKITPDTPPATTRKIFTLNQYTLAKLRAIAKKNDLSIDELVNCSLFVADTLIRTFKETRRKYSDESYVFKEIDAIWTRVSHLRYGLEQVFEQDYDLNDPENLNWWFADIENGLQELETLVKKLFAEKPPKKAGKK